MQIFSYNTVLCYILYPLSHLIHNTHYGKQLHKSFLFHDFFQWSPIFFQVLGPLNLYRLEDTTGFNFQPMRKQEILKLTNHRPGQCSVAEAY